MRVPRIRQFSYALLLTGCYLALVGLARARPGWGALLWLADAQALIALAWLGWRLSATPTTRTPTKLHSETVPESERFRLIADAAPFPLLLNRIDNGSIVYVNPQAARLFGISYDTPQNNKVQALYADPGQRACNSATMLGVGANAECEVELIDASQQRFWALVASSLLRIGGELYVISGFNDISDRKRLEQRLHASNAAMQRYIGEIERLQQGLREQAIRDALTGVYNRRHLDSMLPRLLEKMRHQQLPLSVLLLDADHFKRINDTYGHKTGDYVLATIGQVLCSSFRATDIPCRYGGEEFVVVMPATLLQDAELKAGLLRRQLETTPITAADGSVFHFTVSIGVASFPQHADHAELLIRQADAALYRAKNGGRNQVSLPAMQLQS